MLEQNLSIAHLRAALKTPSIPAEAEQRFKQIILKVLSHPDEFKFSGAELDKHFSPIAIRKRWANELLALRQNPKYFHIGRTWSRKDNFPPPRHKPKAKDLSRYERFKMAIEEVRCEPPDFDTLEKIEKLSKAKKVILLVWLMVDPDCHTYEITLTDFQRWCWKATDEAGVCDDVVGRSFARVAELEQHSDKWNDLAKVALEVMRSNQRPEDPSLNLSNGLQTNTPSVSKTSRLDKQYVSQGTTPDRLPRLQSQIEAVEKDNVAKLERDTPPLDKYNGLWVRNVEASKLESIETATLASYRKPMNGGIRNDSLTWGRDCDGRIWRRMGTPCAHPWYLRSTLKSLIKLST